MITWANPAASVYGTALSATQLNASSGGVAGTFVYTPPPGTILGAGSDQTLRVSFTPTDMANFNVPAQARVTITVIQAPQLITFGTAPDLTYGGGTGTVSATASPACR